MNTAFSPIQPPVLRPHGRRGARRHRPTTAMGAGEGRRQAARGAGRQDGLDRSAVGPDGAGRQQPAEELAVHGREVQREQPGRGQVRGDRHRQQALAHREPERAEVGDRPGHPLHHPGQRLVGGAGAGRRDQQVQRAQSRQGSDLPQRGRGRSGPDQQQVQLLALPLRRRHDDEDGGDDHLHEGPEGHQEGLPAEPELLARPAGREVRQGIPEAQAPRHRDRRRGPAPARRRCATSRPTSRRSRPRAPTR